MERRRTKKGASNNMQRRAGDLDRDQIEEMISDEDDKKIRSVLLIAQNFITMLNELRHFIHNMDVEFKEHKESYDRKAKRDDRIIIQAQTVYKGVTALLITAQGALIGLAIYGYQSFSQIRDQSIKTAYQVEEMSLKLNKLTDTLK
jgi:hypothetical protein